MSRMKELYENIWYSYVEHGMSAQEISTMYNVPLDWVESALEIAEQDEYYDSISSQAIH